jgi:hypothetical protein
MSKRESNWYVPADWLWHFSIHVMLLAIVLLTSISLSIVGWLNGAALSTLYRLGLGASIVGIMLLFISRLPLYRKRRFWTIGPKQLDQRHRRFYWLAYIMIIISLLLFTVVWLRAA